MFCSLFSYNPIETLPAALLVHAPNATQAQFAGLLLREVPANFFDPAPWLTHIALDHNALTALPPAMLHAATALESLTLGGNMLTALPTDFFRNATALAFLCALVPLITLRRGAAGSPQAPGRSDLDNNRLATLDADLLTPVRATLRALSLSGNSLTAMPLRVNQFPVLDALCAVFFLPLGLPVARIC